jgi:hypothetical protein
MSARHSIVVGVAFVVGCGVFGEPAPNVGSPSHHDAHGLAFDYPGNWTLKGEVEDSEGVELYSAEVESPGNALVLMQQFKPAISLEVESLMAEVSAGMQEGAKEELGGMADYTEGGTRDIDRTLLGETRPGKEKRFTLGLLGQKVAHTMLLYPLELEDRSLILYLQIPDEDSSKAQPGFDQILDSLTVK